MSRISSERLSGIIAGAFFYRSMLLVISALGMLALPMGEITDRIMPALISFVPAVIGGFLGYGYLLEARKKWFYVITLIALSLSACVSFLSVVGPFFMQHSTDDAMRSSARLSMVGRSSVELCMALALLVCVVCLMTKEKRALEFKPLAS
jgi:uncharacterized membrane protein